MSWKNWFYSLVLTDPEILNTHFTHSSLLDTQIKSTSTSHGPSEYCKVNES